MKEKDWIVAGLNNPTFDNFDFETVLGLTTDNTQLLTPEEYLKSSFIQNNEAFAGENGEFSQDIFEAYYRKRLNDFQEFQSGEYARGPMLDAFDPRRYDPDRRSNVRIKDPQFSIRRVANPNQITIGISGINEVSAPKFSVRELAKQSKIYDTATGKYLDYSVNDHTLVTSPLEWLKDRCRDPLVLATWDEDGEHYDPFSGQAVQHRRGEYKLNDKGQYYYETLNGRNVLGKDVLSGFDTLTVDGKGLNKIDFFDSNDIKKSVMGSIFRTAASFLPYAIGGEVAAIFGALEVLSCLATMAPTFYGLFTSYNNNEAPSWVNTLGALGKRTSFSVSDYAAQNPFGYENIIQMAGMMAGQWGMQQSIAKGIGMLNKSATRGLKEAEALARAKYTEDITKYVGKEKELWNACVNKYIVPAQKAAEKTTNVAREISLVYMGTMLNEGVYEEMLEQGASKKDAALVTLGSIIGTYSIDKFFHLGEIFLKDPERVAIKQARDAIRLEYKKAGNSFKDIAKSTASTEQKTIGTMAKAYNTTKRALSSLNENLKYYTTTFSEKVFVSGLQNTAEVLASDASKSFYELAGYLGANTSIKDAGSWDNWYVRYPLNFIGGVIGGGMFGAKELYANRHISIPKADMELASLIRNGHADLLRQQLRQLHNEGKLASKNLSAYQYAENPDGTVTYLTAADEQTSHSQRVFDMVNDHINMLEESLIGNKANLSDEELFENMVLSEYRYNQYQKLVPVTNYYNDFAAAFNRLFRSEQAYRAAQSTIEGIPDGHKLPHDSYKRTAAEQAIYDKNISTYETEYNESLKLFNEFKSGDASLDYTRKLNFALDPTLHGPFLNISFEDFFKSKYPGKSIDSITVEDYEKIMKDYEEYCNTALKQNLTEAYKKFKQFGEIVNPHLDKLAEQLPAYKIWAERIKNLFGEKSVFKDKELFSKYKTFDSKLDDESEEDFNDRNKQRESETEEAYQKRRFNRNKAIIDYNTKVNQEIADRITETLDEVDWRVDPQTARLLKKYLNTAGRFKDLLDIAISYYAPDGRIRTALSALPANATAEDIDNVINTIQKNLEQEVINNYKNATDAVSQIIVTDEYGHSISLAEHLENEAANVDPITLAEIVNSENYFTKLSEEDNKKIKEAVHNILKFRVPGVEEHNLYDYASGTVYTDSAKDYLTKLGDKFAEQRQEYAKEIINSVLNNPLYKLQQRLKADIVNPISELIKEIAQSGNDGFPEIEQILKSIQDDFENVNDISELVLDDVQIAKLDKAKAYLQLLGTYLYSASTTPSAPYPIGHNITINQFAESHKKQLTVPWTKLPEIDSDYATLLANSISNYLREIDTWIDLSDANAMDKGMQAIESDPAFNKTLFTVLESIPDTFEYNGNTYNLKAGIDSIDRELLSTEGGKYAQVALSKLERLFYNNIQIIAKDNKITVLELCQNSNLLERLIPGIKNLNKQQRSSISKQMSVDTFTDYDRLTYIIMLLSEDPVKFYKILNDNISQNPNVAPITTQEYSERIVVASTSETFKKLWEYALSLAGSRNISICPNTTVINGPAGAGKTQVILRTVDNLFKKSPVIIAAPKSEQAKALQTTLGRDKSMTFSELFEELLGKKQYNDILTEVANAPKTDYKGEYFNLTIGEDGLPKIKLNSDKIKFNKLKQSPKVIYLDEATHLNTVEALLIDAYAESVGAQVFMAGDYIQRGFFNSSNGISNIGDDAFFAVRTPDLVVSLRDNNIQKSSNQKVVRDLLKIIHEKRLYDSNEDYRAYFETARNIYGKFNLRAYYGEALTGDIIVNDIDGQLIRKLLNAQKIGKSIAFVGDINSALLAKLINAGIKIDGDHTFTLDTIQGQEFDYVVTDSKFDIPNNIVEARLFLQDLYTLITRSRSATIYIGSGLDAIIGNNNIDSHTATAPTIKNVVNELIQRKIDILEKIDTNEPANPQATDNIIPVTPQQEPPSAKIATEDAPIEDNTSQENVVEEEEERNIYQDFEDPDERVNDDESKKEVINISEKDKKSIDNNPIQTDKASTESSVYFPIECYGEPIFTGAEIIPDGEGKNKIINSSIYKGKVKETDEIWRIPVQTKGTLRNLQILCGKSKAVVTLDEKTKIMRSLYMITAAIKGNINFNDSHFPEEIRKIFTEEAWSKGRFVLEFRPVNENEAKPPSCKYEKSGIEYEKNKRVVASIVFSVKNKDGRLCKFDIASINNPTTLIKNLDEIKKGLLRKLNTLPDDDPRKISLQKMYDNADNACDLYTAWFNNHVKNFDNTGESIEVDVTDAIIYPNITLFRKRKGKPIRFGERIDPESMLGDFTEESIKDKQDMNNLIDESPDCVFSPIYVFTNESEKTFGEIDPSIKGKAVVFVSSCTSLAPEELINEYIAQKKEPDKHTARVRMLPLDNYGMLFSQLCNPQFAETFKNLGISKIKPFRQNFIGIRMFTSLWNAKASLLRFNEALTKWKTAHKLNDEQVNTLIKAQDDLYRLKHDRDTTITEDIVKDNLSKVNLSESDLKYIIEFNDEYCKDIPMFRLGYTRGSNGFHIQQFDVSKGIAYRPEQLLNGKIANLCALTPERATTFLTMIQELLKPLCGFKGSMSSLLSLGLKFSKIETINGKEEYLDWDERDFIDLEDSDHQRSLAGFLAVKDRKIVLKDGTKTKLKFGENSQWTIVPKLIADFTRTLLHYQLHPEEYSNASTIKSYATVTDGKKTAVHLMLPLDIFLGNEDTPGLLKQPTKGIDHSFINMLNLIFHGTVEDIHSSNKHIQMTDAIFKHGFFTSTDIVLKEDKANHITTSDGKEILFYQVSTHPALFTVNTDVRSAGLQLSLDKLLGLKSNTEEEVKIPVEEVTPEVIEQEPASKKYSRVASIDDVIDTLNAEGIRITEDAFNTNDSTFADSVDLYESRIAARINEAISSNNTEDIIKYLRDTVFAFIKNYDGTISSYTREQYLKELINPDNLCEIIINDSGVFMKKDDSYYKYNGCFSKDTITEAEYNKYTKPTTEITKNILTDIADPDKGLTNLDVLKTAVSQLPDEIDTQTKNDFIKEVESLRDKDADEVKQSLEAMPNNSNFEALLDNLAVYNIDIYNKLFINCL